MKRALQISGMRCGACESKLATALANVDGVVNARVSQQRSLAEVTTSAPVEFRSLRSAVRDAGDYDAHGWVDEADDSDEDHPEHVSEDERNAPGNEVQNAEQSAADSWWLTYKPLVITVIYLLGGTLVIAVASGIWQPMSLMANFMGLFFVTFSFFKMLDLKGFANAYASYDLIANRWFAYGFVYPFIELALGLMYLLAIAPVLTNLLALLVMTVSAVGVIQAVLRDKDIQCGCLGTMFDLPMSTVTIVEDLSMAVMAGLMLGWQLF